MLIPMQSLEGSCAFCGKFAGGLGALPLADVPQVPVNRPPFLYRFVIEYPPFHNFTPNDPLFLLDFDQNFPVKSSILFFFFNFINRSKNLLKNVLQLPRFCAISHLTTPLAFSDPSLNDPLGLFGSHPMTPLFERKLSLIATWFDASVGAPKSLLYVRAPPRKFG